MASAFTALRIVLLCTCFLATQARDYSQTECETNTTYIGVCQRNDQPCDCGYYQGGLCTILSPGTPGPGPHSLYYHSCCIRSEDCGLAPNAGNNAGGLQEADPNSWPWQVSLVNSSNVHFCSGAILSEKWIVTAAHCVEGELPADITVRSGEHDLTQVSGLEQDHVVEIIITHPHFINGANFPNDIALLKLQSQMTFDNNRGAICLPADNEQFSSGAACYMTGWDFTPAVAHLLHELDTSVPANAVCSAAWNPAIINNDHICADTGNSGVCVGDGGGPLACLGTGESRWVLAGVNSFGDDNCDVNGTPTVFSRITSYRQWLKNTIKLNNN